MQRSFWCSESNPGGRENKTEAEGKGLTTLIPIVWTLAGSIVLLQQVALLVCTGARNCVEALFCVPANYKEQGIYFCCGTDDYRHTVEE